MVLTRVTSNNSFIQKKHLIQIFIFKFHTVLYSFKTSCKNWT